MIILDNKNLQIDVTNNNVFNEQKNILIDKNGENKDYPEIGDIFITVIKNFLIISKISSISENKINMNIIKQKQI